MPNRCPENLRTYEHYRKVWARASRARLSNIHYPRVGYHRFRWSAAQPFLQRIVNGGGRIDREYGLGRKRTDLLVQWPLDAAQGFLGPVQRAVLELKLLHKSLEATLREGLAQTADYLDRTGAEEGHLLLFDRTPGVPWEQKLFRRTERHGSHRIQVWGM